jgi:transcriptional regulator with XRE-family HTH domain
MALAQRIRQRRAQLGLSQSALARHTGIPQSRLSEFEHGSKTGMTLETAKRLARALGVSIDYLAGTWDDVADVAPNAAVPEPTASARR